jgi:hypothetical protein
VVEFLQEVLSLRLFQQEAHKHYRRLLHHDLLLPYHVLEVGQGLLEVDQTIQNTKSQEQETRKYPEYPPKKNKAKQMKTKTQVKLIMRSLPGSQFVNNLHKQNRIPFPDQE